MESNQISIDNWVMRIQRPAGNGPYPVLLMLHGWTGDENSMWIFANRLPKDVLLIAPRGIYLSKSTGGYSWYAERTKPWPLINDFSEATEKLYNTLREQNFPEGDFAKIHLVGFSQGAALAYTMTIMHPERVASLAGLAGFLPDNSSAWLENAKLQGLSVFIAHGTVDNLVPVERARESVELLEEAGASVTYCEDQVGHKLSAKCFRGLEAFYAKVKC